MNKLVAATIAATLVFAVHALPAGAQTTAPQFRTERAYFHCAGPTKSGNVSLLVDGTVPSWDTTAPSQSVQDGAGCGTADANAVAFIIEPQKNPTDGVWEGTFTGNLDRLTVELYNMFAVGTSRVDNAGALGVRLAIDGVDITGNGTDAHGVTAVETNSGVTQRYDFSVVGINVAEPNVDNDGDGIGDNPFGQQEHTITLTVDGYFAQENALGTWVYDTTEVPAGITFNPTLLAPTVISRQ